MPEFIITGDDAGQRLDVWLATRLPGRSRTEIQRWIRDGAVLADGRVPKPSHRLEAAQQISVTPPAVPLDTPLEAERIPLDVLFENTDILVVDKPAGMVVHPAPGHVGGTLVNAVMHHCPEIEGVGGERRPGIVHRLDKDTSGVIVVAKHDRALRDLQAQFKSRTVEKEYLALLEGRLEQPNGRIAAPIGRHPSARKRQAVYINTDASAVRVREAITDYRTEATYSTSLHEASATGHFTLVRAMPHTGRTHQLRVHFAWLKHPIVGDTLYGYKRQRLHLDRPFLHAHRLRICLPSTHEPIDFVSPLPSQLAYLLEALERDIVG